MTRSIFALILLALVTSAVTPAIAARPDFGQLFYDGTVVRTVVPPAAMTREGIDNFYAVMDGAEGQLAVAAVAPGDRDYHGGKWAFHLVTWNVAAYLLTSEAAVRDAAAQNDVTIIRMPPRDFKCPIQP